MRKYPLDKVRNIGIIAHIDAGKTTLSERVLYYSGKIHRMGGVDEGDATMDWMLQERNRGITITSAATTLPWKDHYINLIDTPGHVDFTIEVERSLRVLDGVVVVFSAVEGVESQSETVWRQADRYRTPRLAFVNKMDRLGADFFMVVAKMREKLGANALPLTLPIGAEDSFVGQVDLVDMVEVVYDEDDSGMAYTEREISASNQDSAQEGRDRLLESLADVDDLFLEKYLDGGGITPEDIKGALRRAVVGAKVVPVFSGSALRNRGVQRLLDGVVNYLPSPLDVPPVTGVNGSEDCEERPPSDEAAFSALAFKIAADPHVGKLIYFRVYSGHLQSGSQVYNASKNKSERVDRILMMHANKREDVNGAYTGDVVAAVGLKGTTTGDTLCDKKHPLVLESITFPHPVISVAIEPKTKADQDKLSESMRRLSEEDPSFTTRYDNETGQTIISGMGELHLEIIIDRLLREFNLKANVGRPQVAYRESVRKSASAEGRYVRQTGGRGQYGHVWLKVEPIKRGDGFRFQTEVVGGKVPREFFSAIEEGAREAMDKGILVGYPMVDVMVTLYDGSSHEIDSSDIAYKMAASIAFQEAARAADAVLLEPVMEVSVTTPEEYLGEVMGDLTGREAKIEGTELEDRFHVVKAKTPLSKMFGYATDVRSLSQGRATYYMEFSHYQEVPEKVTEDIILRGKWIL